MSILEPGMNPREALRSHRERGPKVYGYTYKDVAAATGLAPSTVQGMRALASVLETAWLICSRQHRRAAAATDADLVARFGPNAPALWANRWPRLDVWRCPVAGCATLLLERSSCRAHGGGRAGLVFGPQGHFIVGDESLPRIIMGDPPGLDVHHIDFNKWNNRRENLEALSREAHQQRHMDHFGVAAAATRVPEPAT